MELVHKYNSSANDAEYKKFHNQILMGQRIKLKLPVSLGIYDCAYLQVREMIFQNLLEAGDFHGVSQQALKDFVRFIIQQDNIDGCLHYAVSNNL